MRGRLTRLVLLLLALAGAPARAAVRDDVLLADRPAATLAEYGLFKDAAGLQPEAGVHAYSLQTPLFTDYALKRRYLYLPPGTRAAYRGSGLLDLPVGSALIKTFAYPADFRDPDHAVRSVETRLLIHQAQGWVARTYVWNAAGDAAALKRAGARLPVSYIDARGAARTLDYAVPDLNQCKSCHSQAGQLTPLGPKARNLNTVTDGAALGQWDQWRAQGLIADAPPATAVARTERWDNPAASLDSRARAYLDANCGHCHSPQGLASNSGLFLDWDQSDRLVLGVRKRPVAAGHASGDLFFDIDPGRPDQSILIRRLETSEPGAMMPQIGRSVMHEEGVALLRRWIAAMAPAP